MNDIKVVLGMICTEAAEMVDPDEQRQRTSHLSTLSTRVVEAAVAYVAAETVDPTSWPGGPEAWVVDQSAAWSEMHAAVDALLAAKEGR